MKTYFSKFVLSFLAVAAISSLTPQVHAAPAKLYFAKDYKCQQLGFSVYGDRLIQQAGSCLVPPTKAKLTKPGPFEEYFDQQEYFKQYRNSLKVTYGVSDVKDNYDYRIFSEEGTVYVERGTNRSIQLSQGVIKHVDLEGTSGESVLFGLESFKFGGRAQANKIMVAAKQGLVLGTIPKLAANGRFIQESGSLVGFVSGKRLKDSTLPLEYNQENGAVTYSILNTCKVKLAGVTVKQVLASRVEVEPTAVLPEVVFVKDELVLHKNPFYLRGTKKLEKSTHDLTKLVEDFAYKDKFNAISKTYSTLVGIQKNNPLTRTYLASFNKGTLVIDVPEGEEFLLKLDQVPILGFSKIHKRGAGRLVIEGTGKKKFADPSIYEGYFYEDADSGHGKPETVTVISDDANISAPDLKPANVQNFSFTRPFQLTPEWSIPLIEYFAEFNHFQTHEVPWRGGAPDFYTYCDDEDWKYHDGTDESEANADQAKANWTKLNQVEPGASWSKSKQEQVKAQSCWSNRKL